LLGSAFFHGGDEHALAIYPIQSLRRIGLVKASLLQVFLLVETLLSSTFEESLTLAISFKNYGVVLFMVQVMFISFSVFGHIFCSISLAPVPEEIIGSRCLEGRDLFALGVHHSTDTGCC
jgi:hypothetical protein